MTYTPHTDAERRAMLSTIGVDKFEQLLKPIPADLRAAPLNLPAALTEADMLRHLSGLAKHNATTESHISFLGGGAYRHHIPAAVSALVARGEFVTSYTPYQPEVSQGTLQVIYEWQSLICELTGLDIANASLYDGATACAEAAAMAVNATGRSSVIAAGTLNPEYLGVLRTYVAAQGLILRVAPVTGGTTDPDLMSAMLDGDAAAVLVQSPNFYGLIENQVPLAEAAHDAGALYIGCSNPLSLAILAPPGEVGADIAVGEAQPFGVPLQYGGPYVGFLAARETLMRRMPGRIVGASVDNRGNRAYVLTLQTREQHIKRDKATSNICTNEALCATAATIYLAQLGKAGLRDVAELCVQKAHYTAQWIAELPGYSLRFAGPFFHEFVIRCPKPAAQINRTLLGHGIIGGIPLDSGPAVHDAGVDLQNCMLICVTEVNTRDDIDALAGALKAAA